MCVFFPVFMFSQFYINIQEIIFDSILLIMVAKNKCIFSENIQLRMLSSEMWNIDVFKLPLRMVV